MLEIRYWTSHDDKSSAYWREWFSLPTEYNLVYDGKDPDYLIATEHIYSNALRLKEFCRLNNGKRISIFAGGEAISPDMNIFDYACSFDRNLFKGGRNIRKPPALFFEKHVFAPLTEGCRNPAEELGVKTGFCNFIYSNPNAHPRRDQLFYAISQYKPVDSLGPHLNNVGNVPTRTSLDWRESLVKMKHPYKFSIAAENACFDGYVTEKLISSFQAHTVPIYWGDPSVAKEFNPRAFINANGLSNYDLVKVIRRIDADDALWCDIVSQPAMTAEQALRFEEDSKEFSKFFCQLFDARPLAEKKCVPAGFWNDIYKGSLLASPLPKLLRHWFG